MNIPYAAIKPFEPYGIPNLVSNGAIPTMLKTLALSLKLMKTTIMPEHFLEDIERMMLDKGAVKAKCKLKSIWSEEGMPQGYAIATFWSMTGKDIHKDYVRFTFPYPRTK